MCSKEKGSYYDHLVQECISCYSICGQHPKQCAHICQATVGPLPHLEKQQSEDPAPSALVYTVLGLCVCAIFCCFFIKMACFLIRKGNQPGPKREQTSIEDHLMEAGSAGNGSKDLKIPEPVETCSFCFPEQTPPTEESTAPTEVSCPEVPPQQENVAATRAWVNLVGTASLGPTSGCKEGCLKIICSPSQEKTPSP
ncbi:tumor necrosis factor receptor superfamily member 13B isoform X2 [Dromiciops gliroides]|nr:tumor necrosis factor receptor superfamily member 13B isoform X2 [Dromiciops gliroides]